MARTMPPESPGSLQRFLRERLASSPAVAPPRSGDALTQIRAVQWELEALETAMELRSIRRLIRRYSVGAETLTDEDERELEERLNRIQERLVVGRYSESPLVAEELEPFRSDLKGFRAHLLNPAGPRPRAP